MSKSKFFIAIVLLVFVVACAAQIEPAQQPLENEGQVFLYLNPIPLTDSRLRFSIEEIAAVRADGSLVPLSLDFEELKGQEPPDIQRRLASGVLTPGRYKGISIDVREATIVGEKGEGALLVSEEPVVLKYEFTSRPRMAQALFLTFEPLESVKDVSFKPVLRVADYGRRELQNLKGFVSSPRENIVTVFNKKTMDTIDVIAMGMGPRGIVLDQDADRPLAFVALEGDDAVEIIDVFTERIVGRIDLAVGDGPTELAFSPALDRLISVNQGSDTVSIIDASSQFVTRRIAVGQRPYSAVVEPSGGRAFVFNTMSSNISVVDLRRQELLATVTLTGTPLRGAFNSEGDRLYVVTEDSPHLIVMDPSRLTVEDRIFVGPGALFVEVDNRSDLIYVGKEFGEVTVMDPSSLMFIDVISTEGDARYITIDDEENTLFALSPEKGSIQKISLVNKKTLGRMEVAEDAFAVVVMKER